MDEKDEVHDQVGKRLRILPLIHEPEEKKSQHKIDEKAQEEERPQRGQSRHLHCRRVE